MEQKGPPLNGSRTCEDSKRGREMNAIIVIILFFPTRDAREQIAHPVALRNESQVKKACAHTFRVIRNVCSKVAHFYMRKIKPVSYTRPSCLFKFPDATVKF